MTRLLSLALLLAPAFGLDAAAQAPVTPVREDATTEAPATPAAPAGEPIMLGLREGTLLWGRIEGHDETGLDFRRLDNDGFVHLPWTRLAPRFEESLRQRFGYVDIVSEEVLVSAERLRTVDGQEVIGRIVHRTEDAIHVKTARSVVAIPMGRLDGPATLVRVPALDVYTREEFYQLEKTARLAGLEAEGREGAVANFEMGQFCERILDYERAAEHYRLAGERDAAFRPDDVAGVLARAERKAVAQAQVDSITEIRRQRQQKNFAEALALSSAFRDLYPDSPLFEDLNRVEASVVTAQKKAFQEEVERGWHFWAQRLTSLKAREFEFDAAVEWAQGKLGDEIVAEVLDDVRKIDPEATDDAVRAAWAQRKRGRARRASYGFGTFLLGEDRARAGAENPRDAAGGEASSGSGDAARAELEERIRRFLDQQRVTGRGRRSQTGPDPAEFWSTWPRVSRGAWILAYYAEFGGDFDVREVQFKNCRDCNGTGVREVLTTGPAVTGGSRQRSRIHACPTCQHVGIVRRVSYH